MFGDLLPFASFCMFGRFASLPHRLLDSRRSRVTRAGVLGVANEGRAGARIGRTVSAGFVALGVFGCIPDDGLPPVAQQGPPPGLGVPPEPTACEDVNPVPAQARLLTRFQYDNTVHDLFRGHVSGSFTASFPAENEVMGFGNNAEHHRATPWLAEEHVAASEAIAARAVEVLGELLPCAQSQPGAECAASFVREYGARAFRRPLLPSEEAPFLQLFQSRAAEAGFTSGIESVARALLQSPQFLYRFETSRAQPLPGGRGYELSSYELASRLSYFLWNTMPDDELLQAAATGRLADTAELETQARRLLSHPRARATVLDFYRQWLSTRRLGSVVRVAEDQRELALGESWKASLERFLDWTFWEAGGNVRALLESPVVFVDSALAQLYQVHLDRELQPGEWAKVEFEPTQRAGLLTQPGLMALLSHAAQSAPIQRGVFVLERLLCQPPPSPPPSVDQSPPDPAPGLTTRERFREHTEQPVCAGCHRLIDPFGLGLESFDQLGRFRVEESGHPIDVSATVVGTRDETLQGAFDGARQLVERLAASEQVRQCLVTQWYRYALGRAEEPIDLCSIQQIESAMREHDGSFQEMMIAIVLSDAFRYRDTEYEEELP